MFLAFDYPLPISAIGRRSVSTVPSQALILMNDEFLELEAGEWDLGQSVTFAASMLKSKATPTR